MSRDAVDGHNGPITPGVSISNGGGAAEAAGPSEFDFDAMAEAVEMKVSTESRYVVWHSFSRCFKPDILTP